MSNMHTRLKELRRKNSLSQSDVAKRLNSTPALVSAYENNERSPSLDRLILLADIYNTTTDYILGRSNIQNDKIFIDVTDLSEQQRLVINSLIKDMQNYSK